VCALPGCDVEFPRRQGGRPRLYCSDAHRAEAHRRRQSAPEDTETLLRRLLASIAQAGADAPGEAALAQARAEAAEQVARARAEEALALSRAEDAEAALAEREEEATALADELDQVKGTLVATREELARTVDEAAFERHAAAERAQADLALVRTTHAAEREAWDQERAGLHERIEQARYAAARAEATADDALGRTAEALARAEEMKAWAETAIAHERTASAERHVAQEAAAEARRQAMAADAERQEALARADQAQAEARALAEDRDRLGRMVRELERALAGERQEHTDALEALRDRLGRTERALRRSQLRTALLGGRTPRATEAVQASDTPPRQTGRNRKGGSR